MGKSTLVAISLVLGAFSAGAVTNSLTYAASLGRFLEPSGVVTNVDLTGEAEMTVTLYGSKAKAAEALWSRRLSTYVEQGLFAVELTDAAGYDDGARAVRYVKLNELLGALRPSDELWVEISNVVVAAEGRLLATGGQRGRLGGVPFALVAERATLAQGDFTVNGNLTAVQLVTEGTTAVRDGATFGGRTVFRGDVMFGKEGLVVSGLLRKPTIACPASLRSPKLVAHGALKVENLTATNLTGSTLSAATGGSAPESVAVKGVLSSERLSAASLSAPILTITGKLFVESGAALAWQRGGSLTIPGGVYAPAEMPTAVYSQRAYTPAATARHSISTLAVAGGTGTSIELDGQPRVWCRLGPVSAVGVIATQPQIVATVLVPLPRNATCTSQNGAVTASRKELE